MQARFDPATCNVYCSTRPTATTPRTTARRPGRNSRASPRWRAMRVMWRSPRERAAPRARRFACFRPSRTPACLAAATRSPGRTMWRVPCAISSPRVAGGGAIRSGGSRSVKPDWRAHVPQTRRLGPQTRTRLVAGHLRGRSRQLHDRNRRLRAAGAHAALVVRRALHLPAVAAAHGLFPPVRGRVPRQSRVVRTSPRATGSRTTCS